MAILVTGGCGYVGSQVIRKLYQDGKTPVSYDILPVPHSLVDLKDKVRFLRGDVRNATEFLNTIKKEKIECIIHTISLLAADSQQNPASAYETNIGGTVNILEAARMIGVKRVVYISSAAVYGGSANVERIPEEYPLNPVTIYGATKVACEHFGVNYAKNYGIDFISLRLSYVWGPGRQRGVDKLATIVENPIRGLAAKVSGGSQKYEPIYIKDVVKAIVLACFAPKIEHRIFNIGSEEMVTLQEVADRVKEYIPDAEIEISPGHDSHIPARVCTDISKAREELGYQADFKMELALRDYIDQLRANLL